MGVTIQLDVFTSALKWYYLFFSVLIKLNLEISSSFVLSSPRIQCRSSMMGFLRLTPLWKIHKVKVASKVTDYMRTYFLEDARLVRSSHTSP